MLSVLLYNILVVYALIFIPNSFLVYVHHFHFSIKSLIFFVCVLCSLCVITIWSFDHEVVIQEVHQQMR